MSDNPIKYKVSVVVTAYNRKQFLSEALTSLDNQTAKKDLFEVILLTNFKVDLDGHNSLNLKHIVTEGTLGEYLQRGISESSGEIICYLDDDDLFNTSKISIIIEAFKHGVSYYHNTLQKFSKSSEVKEKIHQNYSAKGLLDQKLVRARKSLYFNNGMEFNLSSIAIRRDLIFPYLNVISKIKQSSDTFHWFVFLESDSVGVLDKRILTYYRVHTSTSQSRDKRTLLNWYSEMIGFYEYAIETFHSKTIKNLSKKRIANFMIRYYIYSNGTFSYTRSYFKYFLKNVFFPSRNTAGSVTLFIKFVKFKLKLLFGLNRSP